MLGVIFDPCVNELYWAVKDHGTWLERNGHTKQLHAATFRMTDPGLKVTCSRSHLNEATQAYIAALNAPVIIQKGSALKFLLIASGEAHLYPRIGQTSEWDTGAAQIIVGRSRGSASGFLHRQTVSLQQRNYDEPRFYRLWKGGRRRHKLNKPQRCKPLPQYRFRIRIQPSAEYRCVDLTKVGIKLQIAVIELAQIGAAL